MYIDFSTKTEQQLLDLLKGDSLSKGQRKYVVRILNTRYSLLDSIVYVPTDNHPHYVKEIDNASGRLGLNLLYGDKKTSQKNKKKYYWIDNRGKQRLSYHKGGRPKIFVLPTDIDRISGKRVKYPDTVEKYKSKNE